MTPSGKVRKQELRRSIVAESPVAESPGGRVPVGQAPVGRAVMTMPDLVGVEDVALTHGTARILTLQRPDDRNPLDHATVTRLSRLAQEADANSVVRVLVLTGAGSALSAGGDLRAYLEMYENEHDFRRFLEESARSTRGWSTDAS